MTCNESDFGWCYDHQVHHQEEQMVKPVMAICPECGGQMPVDPLSDVWPHHRPGADLITCSQSGKPLPHASGNGESLKVEGVPVVTIPDEHLTDAMVRQEPVAVIDWMGDVGVAFPMLQNTECHFKRENDTGQPAELVIRMGKGFLAPKVTILVEYPKMPTFSSPEEADEWMERMA